MTEKDLSAEALSVCNHLDELNLEPAEGMAIMGTAIGRTAAAVCDNEADVRRILASIHEHMLQAAGIDDQPGKLS